MAVDRRKGFGLMLAAAVLASQPLRAERATEVLEKNVSQVTFPAAFTGWTWVGMWDATAGNWTGHSPTSFTFGNILSERWYWIGVWDFTTGNWAFGNWHYKMHVPAPADFAIHFVDPTPHDNAVVTQSAVTVAMQSGPGDHYTFLDWDNSLVGWWRFETLDVDGPDTNITDESGNDFGGTFIGGCRQVDGLFGKGIELDGASGYIECGTDVDNTLNAFTVSLWFLNRMNPVNAAQDWVSCRDGSSAGFTVRYNAEHPIAGSAINFMVHGRGVDFYGLTDSLHISNMYNHVTAVFRPDQEALLYYNAQLQTNIYGNAAPSPGNYVPSSNPLRFGAQSGTTMNYGHGIVDDVILFNRALSQQEIKALYDAQAYQYLAPFDGLPNAIFSYCGHAVDGGGNHASTATRSVTIHVD